MQHAVGDTYFYFCMVAVLPACGFSGNLILWEKAISKSASNVSKRVSRPSHQAPQLFSVCFSEVWDPPPQKKALLKWRSRNMPPLLFFCKSPNMFHTVSLNEVDSGNAVTLLCLPSFQSEVWPAALVVLWTGADWAAGATEAVRLSRVGFIPLLLRCPRPRFWFYVSFCVQRSPIEASVISVFTSHACFVCLFGLSCWTPGLFCKHLVCHCEWFPI